jgi:hypothetical protein
LHYFVRQPDFSVSAAATNSYDRSMSARSQSRRPSAPSTSWRPNLPKREGCQGRAFQRAAAGGPRPLTDLSLRKADASVRSTALPAEARRTPPPPGAVRGLPAAIGEKSNPTISFPMSEVALSFLRPARRRGLQARPARGRKSWREGALVKLRVISP